MQVDTSPFLCLCVRAIASPLLGFLREIAKCAGMEGECEGSGIKRMEVRDVGSTFLSSLGVRSGH